MLRISHNQYSTHEGFKHWFVSEGEQNLSGTECSTPQMWLDKPLSDGDIRLHFRRISNAWRKAFDLSMQRNVIIIGYASIAVARKTVVTDALYWACECESVYEKKLEKEGRTRILYDRPCTLLYTWCIHSEACQEPSLQVRHLAVVIFRDTTLTHFCMCCSVDQLRFRRGLRSASHYLT